MTRYKSVKDLIECVPKDLIEQVNRSFEIIGDIAVIEVEESLSPYVLNIGKAILKVNSSIKTVLKKKGIHHGEFRVQDLEYVCGIEKYDTIYKENGVSIVLNPSKVYFSARLSNERTNILKNLDNKRVLVMFSGCGPYSFVALKQNKGINRLTSIEINSEGHKYAIQSLELNKNLIKKSDYYLGLIKFLKERDILIREKELVSKCNNLFLFFINSDVKKEVVKFKLKMFDKNIDFYDNELLTALNLKKFNDLLMLRKDREIFLNLDALYDKDLKYILLLFLDFDFICMIDGKKYKLTTYLEKNYIICYLLGYVWKEIEKYDEIFMPLPKDAYHFLDSAFKVASNNCLIHMYDFVKEEDFPMETENKVIEFAKKCNRKVKIISVRKVGQYSPRKYRVCCDFKIDDVNC